MNSNVNPETHPESDSDQQAQIDRPFTYRVSIASVIVGGALAALAWIIILSLARPSTVQPDGKLAFNFSSLFFPISLVIAGGIMFWAVFSLPIRIARRRGVILDPEVWPWTGAVIVGILAVIVFVLGILTGVI